MKQLEDLFINDQEGLIDLRPLRNVKKLRNLDVYSTQIIDLSPLEELQYLQHLCIYNTKINNLQPLEGLKNLKRLYAYLTSINNLEPLKKLVNLQLLDISSTQISDLEPLKKLVKLQSLDISSTQISDLSFLNGLTYLQILRVSNSKVSDLNPLSDLTQLKSLSLSNTQVSDLSPIKDLFKKADFKIECTNCPLTTPPKEIVERGNDAIVSYFRQIEVSKIDKKYKFSIKIKKILSESRNTAVVLPNLDSHLMGSYIFNDLSSDLFTNKEEKKFDKNFYQNNISQFLFKYSGEIHFDKKTLFPKEFFKVRELSELNSNKRIELRKLNDFNGTVELYEAKLIIVGEGATGKTTLFEKLKDSNHQVGDTDETHGINIHEGLPFKHNHIGENIFNANLWDFGGQELQYMTHQFFLTPRALYVLMMDARRESPNLAYWFKIISLLGRYREDSTEKVRLLLVFNKRGNTTGTPPQYQDQLKYYEDSLDVQYLEVDFAENDYRFENLQNCIKQSLVTLPIVKSQLPRLWKVVREDLREEAKTENYIDTKRFSVICSKHGITEEEDQWLLSGYLHQLGSLLHFQNDKGLRRLVILSPQWAVDGVYTFLSEESIARNNGRFTETEFLALLARRDYNRDDADVILQLMTKNNFDICYEATEHNYVAAQLLPDNAPQYKWYPKEVLQFRYQYPIMPKGLMSRLIVRLSDNIERDKVSKEQIVWKKGVVLHIKLKEGECRVRLREDDAESKAGLRQILIDVMGDRDARKYALRKVRDTVDDLHKRWFRSIKADEMVPCCCSECTISDNPELHKMEKLVKLRSKDKNLPIRCYESGEEVSTQDLLEGVYDKSEIVEKDNFGKY